MRRLVPLLALSLAALSASGCASMWRGAARSANVAPSGLPWGEEFVRRALVMGSFEQALARTLPKADGAPEDALLRALFRGQVAFYAGQYDESARAFAEADRLTEERYTKSVSRGALSLLVNDRALRYVPPRTERLFSRYYAMLGRVQSGDVSGAAVEARRLSALLEDAAHDVEAAERETHAALREVAGAVFEAAGEWNDAGVAYRNAALLRGEPRAAVDTIVAARPDGDSATLVLVVEQGFVAHYVARTLAIPLDDGLAWQFGAPRAGRHRADSNTAGAIADVLATVGRGRSSGRGMRDASETPGRGPVSIGDAIAAGVNAPRDSAAAAPPVPPATPTATGPTSAGPLAAEQRGGLHDTLAVRTVRPRVAVQSNWLAALDALPDGGVFDDDLSWADPMPLAAVETSVAHDWTPRRVVRTHYLGDRWAHRSWMEIAWPTLVRPLLPRVPLQIALSGVRPPAEARAADSAADRAPADGTWALSRTLAGSARAIASVSDAVGADARRLRGARIARLTARTVTRMAAVEAVRDQHGEAAGLLAGLLVSAVDRADTRAWHLLPGRVTVVRLTVPVGDLSAALLQGVGPNAAVTALPGAHATAGSVHVRTVRVWRDPAGGVGTAASAGDAAVPHRENRWIPAGSSGLPLRQ